MSNTKSIAKIHKRTISIILSIIIIFASFIVVIDGDVAADAAYEKVVNGKFDSDGYLLVPYGKKLNIGPASAVYNDYVTNCWWKTSNSNVMKITNTNGRYATIYACGLGYATVTGTTESYYPLNADLRYQDSPHKYRVVMPITSLSLQKNMSVVMGTPKTLTFSSTPNSAYSQYASGLSFSSSDRSIATVDWTGKVTGHKKGTVTITAKTDTGLTKTCKVKVNPPAVQSISLNTTTITIPASTTTQLHASFQPQYSSAKIKWSSSNKKIAKVDKNGLVKAKKPGKVKITAKVNSKIKAKCKIIVKPKPKAITLNKKSITIRQGSNYTLTYKLKTKKAMSDVTWHSSNTNVATVTSSGTVIPKNTGTTKITATTFNGKKAVCDVTVKLPLATKITLDEDNITLSKKDMFSEEYQLNADVYPYNYDGTIQWISSNENVATVDKNGKVVAVGVGTATITVKVYSTVYDQCTVTVNDNPLDPYKYIEITPKNHLSWPIQMKTLYYSVESGLDFTVCQDYASITDANNKTAGLSSVEKTDGCIYLNYSSKFSENNVTRYYFYIIFDEVKYKVTVSNYWSSAEFDEV